MPAISRSQQPAADQPEANANHYPVDHLLHYVSGEARLYGLLAAGRHRNQKEQERNGQSIVKTGLHVESLTNLHGEARAIDYDLAQPRVRRSQYGGENSRFPD